MSQTVEGGVIMLARRAPWYAAAGGLVGSILGALLMWWLLHCGCPCGPGG